MYEENRRGSLVTLQSEAWQSAYGVCLSATNSPSHTGMLRRPVELLLPLAPFAQAPRLVVCARAPGLRSRRVPDMTRRAVAASPEIKVDETTEEEVAALTLYRGRKNR